MGVKNSNCKESQKNLTFAFPYRVFLAHLMHSHLDVSLMRAESPSVLFTTVSPVLRAVVGTHSFWTVLCGLKAENTYFKWKLST